MAKEEPEPCNCKEYQQQLEQCKDSKCKQCEEDKKAAFITIEKLNKKVFVFTIIMVIAITLLGKDFSDKIINYFNDFDQMNQKIESFELQPVDKKGETSEISSKYEFSSYWFS